MRLKLIIAVGGSVCVICCSSFLKRTGTQTNLFPSSTRGLNQAKQPRPGSNEEVYLQETLLRETKTSQQTEETRLLTIDALKSEIDRAEQRSDAAGAGWLIETLHHSEPVVRHEALQALVRMQQRDTAPGIRSAAEFVSNPDEKKTLLEAADWLELPSTSEIVADGRKSRNDKTSLLKPAPLTMQATQARESRRILAERPSSTSR